MSTHTIRVARIVSSAAESPYVEPQAWQGLGRFSSKPAGCTGDEGRKRHPLELWVGFRLDGNDRGIESPEMDDINKSFTQRLSVTIGHPCFMCQNTGDTRGMSRARGRNKGRRVGRAMKLRMTMIAGV